MYSYTDISFAPLAGQQAHQSAALADALAYLQAKSPFYKRLFQQHAVDVSRIKSVAGLSYLPTTSKVDMQEHNMDFLCVGAGEVREYMATSGTMGRPVVIALTEQDLYRLAWNERQSFLCADGTPHDIYQLMLTLDRQFMAGMAYYMGIKETGAAVVRTGPGLPAMQWDTIGRLQTTSIVSVPSFLLKLADHAQEHNNISLQSTPVKKAICIGESIRSNNFELNTLGEKIHSRWPLKLYSTYASTEMQTAFTECGAGQGGHHRPELLILEVLDGGGRQVPAGSHGEVVITTLGVTGMPLLRYRTGDICAWYDAPCSCGRHSVRLGPVLGRTGQMIKYKGTTLYPPAVYDMLNSIAYIKEYVVEVFTNDLGLDELRLHLNSPLPADACEQQLRPLLQARLRVLPLLQFHSAASIQQLQFPPAGRKQVKFIDNRTTSSYR